MDYPRCPGKTPNGPCRNGAGKGTSHPGYGQCYKHGGRTPNSIKNAERLMYEAQLREAAMEFGIEVEIGVEDALLRALWRAQGMVLYYQSQVKKLVGDQLVFGTEKVTRSQRPAMFRGDLSGTKSIVEDTTHANSRPNVWLVLLAEAEKHLLKVAATVASLDIEQRRVVLAEEQGALMFELLNRVIRRLGIPDDDPRLPALIQGVVDEIEGMA